MDGLLLIDKPPKLTSMDVVREVKKALKVKKAGHTGTLDPIATGLLPVCIGKATKLSQYLLLAEKEYRAQMYLGRETDTLDAEGKVVREAPLPSDLSRDKLESVLKKFEGEILQVPPAFSALKVRGKRAYQLAREGKEVNLPPRPAKVHYILLEEFSPPLATFRCKVSKGTYIRSLIRDIGAELQTPAYMSQLRRLAIPPYSVKEAIGLEKFVQKNELKSPYFLTLEEMFSHWPKLILSPRESQLLKNGNVPKSLSIDRLQPSIEHRQSGESPSFDGFHPSIERRQSGKSPLRLTAYSHRGELLALLQYRDSKFEILRVI